jgi:hypothetical protein
MILTVPVDEPPSATTEYVVKYAYVESSAIGGHCALVSAVVVETEVGAPPASGASESRVPVRPCRLAHVTVVSLTATVLA